MPKCLRCGAGSEWLSGNVPKEPEGRFERVRAKVLDLLHEIAEDGDGGEKRYKAYGPLFDALWEESQK